MLMYGIQPVKLLKKSCQKTSAKVLHHFFLRARAAQKEDKESRRPSGVMSFARSFIVAKCHLRSDHLRPVPFAWTLVCAEEILRAVYFARIILCAKSMSAKFLLHQHIIARYSVCAPSHMRAHSPAEVHMRAVSYARTFSRPSPNGWRFRGRPTDGAHQRYEHSGSEDRLFALLDADIRFRFQNTIY